MLIVPMKTLTLTLLPLTTKTQLNSTVAMDPS